MRAAYSVTRRVAFSTLAFSGLFLRPLGPSSMPQWARSRTTAVAPARGSEPQVRWGEQGPLSDATINPAYQGSLVGVSEYQSVQPASGPVGVSIGTAASVDGLRISAGHYWGRNFVPPAPFALTGWADLWASSRISGRFHSRHWPKVGLK